MATTKLVAHQYVCIRALEAVLVQLTQRFRPGVAYRISSLSFLSSSDKTKQRVKGKILKLSTYSDTNETLEVDFSCKLELGLHAIQRLWYPARIELSLDGQGYLGSFSVSGTYNILVDWVVRKG